MICAIVLPIVVGFVAIILSRRHQVISCQKLVRRLHPHQLSGLSDLLDGDTAAASAWERTHGFIGLWRRWRNRVALVQLAQMRGLMEPMSEGEVAQFLADSADLTYATIVAAWYGLFRCITGQKAGQRAQKALQIYATLTFRTHALYSDDTGHLCATVIAAIL